MIRTAVVTFLAFAACILNAATVTVSTRLHDGVRATNAVMEFRSVVSSADLGKTEADRRITVAANEPFSLELEDGHWALDVVAEGVWHQRQYFQAGDKTEVVAELRPASTIRGRVRKDGPRTATLRFEPTMPGDGVSGETPCAFEEAAFTCHVPAGRYNARIGAPKYIALYFAAIHAPAASAANLGELPFKAGQSITGHVEIARGEKVNVQEVTITAKPRRGSSLTAVKAKPDQKGFFHIDGVAPGEQVLAASHPSSLSSGDIAITVMQGAEAELARPLVLARPRTLSLIVTPPVAPDGSRWTTTLSRLLDDPVAETIETGQIRVDGSLSFTRLQPGRYSVDLVDAEGSTFAYETFEVDSDLTFPILVQARVLRGRVLLADRPIEARIELTDGTVRTAKAKSDSTGRFTMILPEAKPKRWTAVVSADIPAIDRKLQFDELPAEDKELVIQLQNYALTGTLIDAEKKPVSGIVTIAADIGLNDELEILQRFPGEDGTFEVQGMAPGTYQLQAEGDGQRSEMVEVTVSEEQPHAEIVLALKPATVVNGTVLSPLGPVAGARVWVSPASSESMYSLTEITDPRGRFTARLPPNIAEYDVHVAASGFAYTMGHMRHKTGNVVATVVQNGGSITVRAPQAAVLRYAGATTSVENLRYVWHTTANENGSLTIHAMEPGAYSLCSAGGCAEGVLSPFGVLWLEVK
ncbi:MAG TPA: carboxypeptidase-like regulatory domain-containing protein [Thermoanaerobaculia bacterium]|jgi:hypothetical protein|nr:carboxypeptidase-like regulatory domain-containing protein [Thermoanaerobaculia bacterium]